MPMTEQDWHRRQLKAFTRSEGVVIALVRPIMTNTAAGGVKRTGQQVLPKQQFKFYPFKRRLVQEFGLSRDGEQVSNYDYVMVAYHDADVEVGDEFTYQDRLMVVEFVTSQDQRYRTAAGVRDRGPTGGN